MARVAISQKLEHGFLNGVLTTAGHTPVREAFFCPCFLRMELLVKTREKDHRVASSLMARAPAWDGGDLHSGSPFYGDLNLGLAQPSRGP